MEKKRQLAVAYSSTELFIIGLSNFRINEKWSGV